MESAAPEPVLPDELVDAMDDYCAVVDRFSLSGFTLFLMEQGLEFEVSYHDCNGPPAGAEGSYDVYALMAASEFEFEENGWDEFFVS